MLSFVGPLSWYSQSRAFEETILLVSMDLIILSVEGAKYLLECAVGYVWLI